MNEDDQIDFVELLRKRIEREHDQWEICFIEKDGGFVIDETKGIVCPTRDLYLFTGDECEMPKWLPEGVSVIGSFGDDEFAWVCQDPEGTIIELDGYDVEAQEVPAGARFESIVHYLLSLFVD